MKFLSLVGISLRFHTLSFFFLFFFSVMFSFLHAAACYLFYSGQLFFFTTLLPESQENDINSRDKTFLGTGTAIPTFANNLPPSRISLPVEKVSLFYKNIVNRISLALQPKGKEDNFLTTFEYYDRSSPFFSFLFLLFTISWTLKISRRSNHLATCNFQLPYFIMSTNFVQKRVERTGVCTFSRAQQSLKPRQITKKKL